MQDVYLRPWCPVWAESAESSDLEGALDGAPCGHTLTPCLPNDKAENCSPAYPKQFEQVQTSAEQACPSADP